jgi:hypothetical protein
MSNIKLADNTLKNLVDTPSTNYTAYDSSTGDIYFTTWPTGQSGALHRLKADGTLEMLYKLDGGGQGIFLDRTQRRVYWGEYYSGIYYGSMDGAGVLPRTEFISRKQLQQTFGSQHPGFGRSIHGISGMVFNQADNYIYFISVDNHNSSKGTALWRVRIDGSDLKVLHLVVNNACLTVEPTNGYIYIVKDIQGSNRLWRFSLDGSGGIELYTLPSNTICSSIVLDTIADAIYVGGYIASENNSNVLWRFLTDGSDAKKLPHRGGKSGIFISHIASPDNHGICSK